MVREIVATTADSFGSVSLLTDKNTALLTTVAVQTIPPSHTHTHMQHVALSLCTLYSVHDQPMDTGFP